MLETVYFMESNFNLNFRTDGATVTLKAQSQVDCNFFDFDACIYWCQIEVFLVRCTI